MSDGGVCSQLLVKARFAFQPTNEDELSFSKGDVICVTKQVEGGWWEGSLNDKTGWFPSNYVRELKGGGGCIQIRKAFIEDVETSTCYLDFHFFIIIGVRDAVKTELIFESVLLLLQSG